MKKILLTLLVFLCMTGEAVSCQKWDRVYITQTDPTTMLIIPLDRHALFLNLAASIRKKASLPATITYQAQEVELCEDAQLVHEDFPYGVAVGVSGRQTTTMGISANQAEIIIKSHGSKRLPAGEND